MWGMRVGGDGGARPCPSIYLTWTRGVLCDSTISHSTTFEKVADVTFGSAGVGYDDGPR
ncbi:protein of unknown function [Streptomyces sp. KY75]|nr:protein of unknown function [Streptomyces sp. KY75]